MRKLVSIFLKRIFVLPILGAQWLHYLWRRYLVLAYMVCVKSLGKMLPWFLAVGLGYGLAQAIQVFAIGKLIAVVFGVLLSVVLVIKPEYSVLILLTLTSTVIGATAIPKPLTFGGQGFAATELLIIFMLPVVWIQMLVNPKSRPPFSPVIIPLMLFFTAVLMSIGITYYNYLASPKGPFPFNLVYNTVRPTFHYLFFFIVLYSIDTEKKLRIILKFLMYVSCVVAVMMIVQYFLGTRHWIFIGTEEKVQDFSRAELARPLPPGLVLVMTMFIVGIGTATCRTLKSGLLRTLAFVMLLGIALVFTNTRGIWIISIVSMLLIWLVSSRSTKWKLGITAVASVTLVITLSFTIGKLAPGEAGREFAESTQKRFLSIFQKETVESSSIQNRFDENRYAIQQIRQNPVFGIGADAPLGYSYVQDTTGNYSIIKKNTIHNSYLELYMVYGLLGIVSYLWLTLAFIFRGINIYRRIDDLYYRTIVIAFVAAYIGALFRYSYTMALLHEMGNIMITSTMWALVEVIWRVYQDRKLSEQAPGVQTFQYASSKSR